MSLKVHELKPLLGPVGYPKIYSEFLLEAYLFADFLRDANLKKIFADFGDFNRYLKTRSKTIKANTKVAALSKGTNILHAKNANRELRDILSYAHFSACCELFNGWSFNCLGDTKKDLAIFLEHYLSHLKSADEKTINDTYLRIATADSARIIVLLKLLGVLQPDTSKKHILSFGAASGVKELYATHTIPKIDGFIDNKNPGMFRMNFSRRIEWPKQTVLIDYDTHWRTHYENITLNHPANILGIIQEFETAIAGLPKRLQEQNMELADLVLGWRIDHQVIPNAKAFFKSIVPSLSSKSKLDLIVTIGAGDDDADFAGRIKTMDDIWSFLTDSGFSPVRIIMHDNGRETPLFGHGSYATYEIIHCRLNKKKMKLLN